tara:strand:- start:1760 stop:1936 length:177 start_codon:yes stop_codon:yes gene_type:complete
VVKMDITEEIKLKKGLHELLVLITQGSALSDIQRNASRIAVEVGWPFYPWEKNGDEEE